MCNLCRAVSTYSCRCDTRQGAYLRCASNTGSSAWFRNTGRVLFRQPCFLILNEFFCPLSWTHNYTNNSDFNLKWFAKGSHFSLPNYTSTVVIFRVVIRFGSCDSWSLKRSFFKMHEIDQITHVLSPMSHSSDASKDESYQKEGRISQTNQI